MKTFKEHFISEADTMNGKKVQETYNTTFNGVSSIAKHMLSSKEILADLNKHISSDSTDKLKEIHSQIIKIGEILLKEIDVLEKIIK